MATTTNFGWETPDDTDLVKDGAAAIRTALGGVDTSFVDLKGGTTGQLLAKASNTDLDYSWTTVASGGMTQIATGTLSGTSVVISSIPTTYKDLVLVVRSFRPNTDNEYFRLRMNGDTGAKYNAQTVDQGDGISFGDSFIQLSRSPSNTNTTSFGYLTFMDYANTSTRKQGFSYVTVPDSTTPSTVANYTNRTFWYDSTSAVTSLTLYVGAGGWAAGTYILYGVS